ncbi:hypothetical protein SCH01S_15_00280 [Sphingomonas changbaiensis NBRC 104936]|uniref:Uncharacterized protein n=1 Tax=Sphingomonas changbaiensis NBRC 104936 TaxID=1219043 RepID=A0A0E9MLN6_9SPHN|nr:hypothetical protein SCH01S_15_00280 [Sphingomonas changbaiensis NBRC 104936]
MCHFVLRQEELSNTSGLAAQKSQANRNRAAYAAFNSAGLAAQKSQANRNAVTRW